MSSSTLVHNGSCSTGLMPKKIINAVSILFKHILFSISDWVSQCAKGKCLCLKCDYHSSKMLHECNIVSIFDVCDSSQAPPLPPPCLLHTCGKIQEKSEVSLPWCWWKVQTTQASGYMENPPAPPPKHNKHQRWSITPICPLKTYLDLLEPTLLAPKASLCERQTLSYPLGPCVLLSVSTLQQTLSGWRAVLFLQSDYQTTKKS